jgi:hypothetical protein
LVAAVIIFVRVTLPARISGAVLVAKALVIAPILLVFRVLFVARCGTASAACPRGAHRFAPLMEAVAQRVDLVADGGNGSCLTGVDETASHLVGQLGELRRRGDEVGALLQEAALDAWQASATS